MFRIEAKNFVCLFILAALLVATAGCATIGRKWKALVSGRPDTGSDSASANSGPPVTSFSNNPDVMTGKARKYHRVTIDNFDDEQGLDDNAGSLWRKEGQGSYLFSQNSLRNIGDIINVQMDGRAAENLNAKLAIIKQALIRAEKPVLIKRTVASNGIPRPEERNPQPAAAQEPPQANQNPEAARNNEEQRNNEGREAALSHFDDVPCRIVQRNMDGSYRVKGSSSVFVGRHEYKLIITGIVRPEDVTYDDAISSTRILDSKFDLVATNKELKNESH